MPSPIPRRAFLSLLALSPAFALSQGALGQSTPALPQVVATTGLLADIMRRVGGDDIAVRALMGSGVDPHMYRQTRSDVAALARADLVVRHGLHLEAQLEGLFAELSRNRRVVALAESIPVARRISVSAERVDPHVWMEPALWDFAVEAAEAALAALLPAKASAFRTNAATFRAEIAAVDGYARAVLASVPAERRVLVTAHDAFAYFGRAFGFEVEGIQGISTENDAGLRRLQDLVDLIVAKKIGAVFVETSVPDRTIRALVEGAAAKRHAVVIGGSLFSDAMGEEGTYEGTYVGMIDHNVTTIARALGGKADARGMAGKLALVR